MARRIISDGDAYVRADTEPAFVDLTTLTKAELRDIAAVEGVDVPKRATNAQIIDALTQPDVVAALPVLSPVEEG